MGQFLYCFSGTVAGLSSRKSSFDLVVRVLRDCTYTKVSCKLFDVAPTSMHACAELLAHSILASVHVSQAQAAPDANQEEVDSQPDVLTAGELKKKEKPVN